MRIINIDEIQGAHRMRKHKASTTADLPHKLVLGCSKAPFKPPWMIK